MGLAGSRLLISSGEPQLQCRPLGTVAEGSSVAPAAQSAVTAASESAHPTPTTQGRAGWVPSVSLCSWGWEGGGN